ncbi:hypothetical protein AVEN_70403-1 [Araneus ventricosus]|uniref:Uncharacterized protein n=1 Tax=Araneus ventricosus TaxID=182803 RepID=A0A4Y2TS46_ARAVE|nr:hypothetical protein AVEN_70403-1 [Araneus ventricosus]
MAERRNNRTCEYFEIRLSSLHILASSCRDQRNSTTKIRPVFDASAKQKNGSSLNSCLEKGPNLVELIPCILNRFRLGTFGEIADIKKTFL